MNSRRSYLDTINTGRQRRMSSSIEELSKTLDDLHRRIGDAGDGAVRHDAAAPLRQAVAPTPAPRPDPAIAGEIDALRTELHKQMAAGLRREFVVLKDNIERAVQAGHPARQISELRAEFERLASMIAKLAERGDDRQMHTLRLEMEQVKSALGKLAREETVKSVDRRWDEFDRRWDDLATRVEGAARGPASEDVLEALAARLDRIVAAVDALPDSGAMRSLEDKLKVLSLAVDQFARIADNSGASAIEAVEERLDEISRAIAASAAAAHASAFDPEPLQRIEARVTALSRQISEIVEDNPAAALGEQMSALTERVDDIARRVDLPEQLIERLAEQMALIAGKLDHGPAEPDLSPLFADLDGRFARLSDMLERRHEDAMEQGRSLFQELERRLDEVAGSLDARAVVAPMPDTAILDALDERFEEMAARLERQARTGADASAFDRMEARLEALAHQLDGTARPGSEIEPDLLRSLESQVAALSAHVAGAGAIADLQEPIGPRLDDIERSIAQGREDLIMAARMAAEEAARSFGRGGSGEDGDLVAGLADDLKSLEELTRRSDERNGRTFEAIHDTLLKIVDRLGAMEIARTAPDPQPDSPPRPSGLAARKKHLEVTTAPSIDPDLTGYGLADADFSDAVADLPARMRTPASAAQEAAADASREEEEAQSAPAARRSLLQSFTNRLPGRRTAPAAAEAIDPPIEMEAEAQAPAPVDLDAPLDAKIANEPLEPGSGAPDLNAIMRRVRDERSQNTRPAGADAAKSDFIAAARRAAQAAAAEAEMMKKNPSKSGKEGKFGLGRILKRRSKPVMMGVAAILIALAGLQLGKSHLLGQSSVDGTEALAVAPASIVPATKELPLLQASASAVPAVEIDESPDMQATAAIDPMTDATGEDLDWLEADAPPARVVDDMPAAEDIAIAQPEPVQAVALPSIDIPTVIEPAALRDAAEAGEAVALYEIGNRYADGVGVEPDATSAAYWYEQAAERGLAIAQYRIGNIYDKGIGVERDALAARDWYEQAARQGNASAMHNLAVLHAMDAKNAADHEVAAGWFLKAAEFDIADSQFNLGILAAKGIGLDQDLIEAYKWFSVVAEKGDKDAAAKRDEVAAVLEATQLDRARATARLWKPQPLEASANELAIPAEWTLRQDVLSAADMKTAIRNVQHILNKNGYDAGGADGVMGARTKSAIAAFQRDNNLAATGEVDEPLVQALLERR